MFFIEPFIIGKTLTKMVHIKAVLIKSLKSKKLSLQIMGQFSESTF